MKTILTVVTLLVLLVSATSTSASIITFSDNFNDGNADGWLLTKGNWHVENGIFAQDSGGDGCIPLAQGIIASTQSVKTDVLLHGHAGNGGITIWYQDSDNYTAILIYPAYGEVWISEKLGGGSSSLTRYSHISTEETWHQLVVDADSTSGLLTVSLDNSFFFTHQTSTATRTGQSGLISGNSGGDFDNFEISTTIPEPATLGLFGLGLLLSFPVLLRRRRA